MTACWACWDWVNDMTDNEPTFPWLGRLNRWLRPQPAPDPVPEPAPEPAPAPTPNPEAPPPADWLVAKTVNRLKAWKTLQHVPLEQLGSFAVLIPMIVFLAVSGFIAWAALLVAFGCRTIYTALFGWTNRGRK